MARIAVAALRLDGGTQPRAGLDGNTVGEYAEALAAGAVFPPVVVFHDGADYWLADGFHRVRAAQSAELAEIAADVREGTRRDAALYAAGANATHGLRRTNADKRRAVLTLLEDEEWRGWSDREIARRCGVTHPFVAKLRAEWGGNDYHAPGATLAEHEVILQRGLAEALVVLEALEAIRDQRLYRGTHATFADYCRDRGWPFLDGEKVA